MVSADWVRIPPLAGDRPLILAAWHGNISIVKLLLDRDADVNAINFDGNNALHCAAYRGFPDVAALLLTSKATVDVMDGLTGKTALVKAAYAGRTNIVHQLLKSHADTSMEDRQGYTALSFASAFQHIDVLKALLASGARSNTQVAL